MCYHLLPSKNAHSQVVCTYYFGQRYYSAETGRWLSRDPKGENAGYNLYLGMANSPLDRIDVLGLFDYIPNNDKVCNRFKDKDQIPKPKDQNKKIVAGFICFDGNMYMCLWGYQNSREQIKQCAVDHEETHNKNGDIDSSCTTCASKYGDWSKKRPDPASQKKAECEAYKVSFKCLQDHKAECNALNGEEKKACEKEYKDEKRNQADQIRDNSCGRVFDYNGDIDIDWF